ncbi:exodeoxyribonuclease V subunit beta [Candidatus Chlamydia sanziniae]|uniref:RecBCD enzyme subunit RecB n=1 Tax=Candidatus Chlamydia sanziniae TaxID=1806891 RepID=A0A1A9HVV4_9CHLA|nr:exodeoxyribonuclease V subunit beta [Candidatus Chlamydia sanziniae]ANH78541.1 Exodeoxyribonuclease V beta chain [Candidatus Chlamydia sanziniae]
MKPFDIFNPDTSIQGKFFLEASAGTGKTFTLEHIILRGLIEGSITHIENILAVTFTNAAANELKLRIRESLSKCLREFQASLACQEASFLPYLSPHQDVKQLYMNIRNALVTIERMSLFTIHGFCNSVLKQYFPGTRLLHKNPGLTHTQLILHHIQDYLAQDLWRAVLFPEQFQLLAVRYNLHSTHSASLIDKLLANYGTTIADTLPKLSETSTKLTLWHQNIRDLLKNFPKENFLAQFTAHIEGFKKQSFSLIKDIHCFVDTLYSSATHSTLFAFFKLADALHPHNRLARYQPCEAFHILEEMSWLECTSQFCNLDEIFNTLLKDVQEYLKQNYTPWLSPDESILALEKLLSTPEAQPVIVSLRERYQFVLIDEFQDTDKKQWLIFSTLFATQKFQGSFFLIGDPKQSIYEWRNADLPTYLKAKSSFSKNAQLQLINNYRSTPRLMEAINELFHRISPFLKIPGYPPIEYYPLIPQCQEDFHNPPYAPIHFFVYENIESQILWISSEATRLQQEYGIPLGRMVILVSDSEQAFDFITHSTVPISFSKNKSVFHLTETYLLTLVLLEAILYPENYKKTSRVLVSSLFGLSPSEIINKKEQYTTYFLTLHTYISNYGVLATFYHLMSSQGETLLKTPQGDLIFQEMEKLCSYLDTISSYPYHQFLHLQRFSETGRWEEELTVSSYSEDLETLKITTIHSSKGLEYDVVFCPGLDKSKKNKSSSESLREMYVACTRARKQLYLPISFSPPSSCPKFSALTNYVKIEGSHTSTYDLAMHLAEKHPLLFSCSQSKEDSDLNFTTFSLQPPETFSLHLPLPKEIFSFSSVKPTLDSYKEAENSLRFDLNPSQALLPLGEKTGIIIHKIIEAILPIPCKDRNHLFPIVTNFVKHTHLVGFEEMIIMLLIETFFTPLSFPSHTFILADISPEKMFREASFLFSHNENLWQGSIDLFFEHERKYYIIDWKTSFLGEKKTDYSKTNLMTYVQQENLDYQGGIYLEAAKKFLRQFKIDDEIHMGFVFIRGIDKEGNGFLPLQGSPPFNPTIIRKYPVYH